MGSSLKIFAWLPLPWARRRALATHGIAHSTLTKILTHSTRMSHIQNSVRPTSYLIRISHIWNSSPPTFYPDISHPEFFPRRHSIRTYHIRNSSPSTFHPDGILTHSTRMPHIRNSSPSPFHPDISHPEFFIVHSTRTSHIRNSSPPTFHPGQKFSLIPPGYSQSPFCPANILPYPDVSHLDLKVNFFPPRDLKHVHLCMVAFPKSNYVNVFSNSGYFKIISNHQNFLSFILSIFL